MESCRSSNTKWVAALLSLGQPDGQCCQIEVVMNVFAFDGGPIREPKEREVQLGALYSLGEVPFEILEALDRAHSFISTELVPKTSDIGLVCLECFDVSDHSVGPHETLLFHALPAPYHISAV